MTLSNRFPPAVKEFWIGHYTDMIDGRNDADCLHHILSPVSADYIPGDHNKSILNSSPLNNFRNHIGQPMHGREKESKLLKKTLEILVRNDYEFKEVDKKFYLIYERNYKQKTPHK